MTIGMNREYWEKMKSKELEDLRVFVMDKLRGCGTEISCRPPGNGEFHHIHMNHYNVMKEIIERLAPSRCFECEVKRLEKKAKVGLKEERKRM